MMKIVIIGSGNVATHLTIALHNAGYEILQVYSRDITNADILAQMVDAAAIDDIGKVNVTADFYFISVSDRYIDDVARQMPLVKGVVAHTAGSVDMSILNKFDLHGVFYPFQTFTKDKELDFKEVPVLVEGNISHARRVLMEVADAISNRSQKATGEMRKALHISAVYACNFVNHLYALADELLAHKELDFSLLKPLILETTQKALSMKPHHAQTGPARRFDHQILKAHMDSLPKKSFHHEVYALMSESIMKMYDAD